MFADLCGVLCVACVLCVVVTCAFMLAIIQSLESHYQFSNVILK